MPSDLPNQRIDDLTTDESVTGHHVMWLGCGKLLGRTMPALQTVRENNGSELTFIDVVGEQEIGRELPHSTHFFNVQDSSRRKSLRRHLKEIPPTHIFIANWAPQHILTAFKFSELCEGGQIVIAKPLDTNFNLIDTVRSGAWPDITSKLFVHDHYLNKGAVQPIYDAFPYLREKYGDLNTFEFYIIEHRSVEEEGRL